jgi:DnaD/phage-associated family protein
MTQTLRRQRKQKFFEILNTMYPTSAEDFNKLVAENLADAATSDSERRTNEEFGEYKIKPNTFAIYEQNIGAITPLIADELAAIENAYPQDGWFLDATKEAVKMNKRNLKYILAILERWNTDGRGDNRKKTDELIPIVHNVYDPSAEPKKNYVPAPENLRRCHVTE